MKSLELGLCGIRVATGGGLTEVKLGIPPETELGIPNCRGVGGVDDGIDEGTGVDPNTGLGDGLGIGAGVVNGCICRGTGAGGRETGVVGEGPI